MHGWMKVRKRGGCSDAGGLESCLDEDVELELVPSGKRKRQRMRVETQKEDWAMSLWDHEGLQDRNTS